MTTTAQPPKPWAHQVKALEFIRDKPGAMLALEMGCGKTKVAINHMEDLDARRTLVLAPLSVVNHVWPGEIRKHSRRQATIVPLGDQHPNVRGKMTKAAEGLALATARKGPAIVVVNYESAYREPLGSWLKQQHWDLIVMDESHRLKSASGQISRWASQIADRSARRLALTGTPTAPQPHSPTAPWTSTPSTGPSTRASSGFPTSSSRTGTPSSRSSARESSRRTTARRASA